MATVVLFHSALGLTPGTLAFADALRSDGHTVHTPDLFEGKTFDAIDSGVELVDSVGLFGWVERAAAAVAPIKEPRVYVGFSFGAALGEVLALTAPKAQGVVIAHGALSPEWVKVTEWPAGLRAQLHTGAGDPWGEPDEDAAFLALAGDAAESFTYDVSAHLFAFPDWEEYDAEAGPLLLARVREFVATFDA